MKHRHLFTTTILAVFSFSFVFGTTAFAAPQKTTSYDATEYKTLSQQYLEYVNSEYATPAGIASMQETLYEVETTVGNDAETRLPSDLIDFEGTVGRNATEYKTLRQQYVEYKNSDYATPEGIADFQATLAEVEAVLNADTTAEPRSTTGKTLDVPYFEQEESYYCGPATVKQTYSFLNEFLNGSTYSPPQSNLRYILDTTEDGTDQNNIETYLNSSFPSISYSMLWRNGAYTNATQMFNLIKTDINNNKPSIAHVIISAKLEADSEWNYTTGGHYLNFRGYVEAVSTGVDIVLITDPNFDGHGYSSGRYGVIKEAVYAATDRFSS